MEVVLVPTTHWDREWYRTFQAFRARLADTVDRVLELVDADPGYRFLLDGQTIVYEDYLEVRPGRRPELERAVREGRVAIGPWYVQPDSLIPGGEAHVRNLLEGRRSGEALGPVSRVGYTPDSFGHPAQFPQIFAGFGIGHFVYWRGNGNEIMELPAEYSWQAPDGSEVVACHLWLGYFNAAVRSEEMDKTVDHLSRTVEQLAARTHSDRVLLLAGSDHQLPESRAGEIAQRLAEHTGHDVRVGLLEDFVDGIVPDDRPTYGGELVGGRIAFLLPGVWSTRTYLKLHNRRCETLLDGWAEPWAAVGGVLGVPDERPSLRLAWRELLQNQAHDSICGCSQDAVHEQMLTRYRDAEELANETALRSLERIAGLGPERRSPWSADFHLAVFNPSPHPRTDVVRFALEPYPPFVPSGDTDAFIHPLLLRTIRPKGIEVDGAPARLVPAEGTGRVRLIPDQADWEIEFVVRDVPAFGWKRVDVRLSDEHPEEVDEGREIAAGDVAVTAAEDGTFTVSFGDRTYPGLGALEDIGDRGDTYDHDPVAGEVAVDHVAVYRSCHPSGIQRLATVRRLLVPGLDDERRSRTGPVRPVEVTCEVQVTPGVDRVDLRVRVDNEATDHRLRILFPTGAPAERFEAATTFDVAERAPGATDDTGWRHPAPRTFPHQGWIRANGLTVCAPGLPEAEVTPDGVVIVTLLRAVGWLSRLDLESRTSAAGPSLPTPGAQCPGPLDARMSLLPPGAEPRAARDAELGLRAVAVGNDILVDDGVPLLELDPPDLLVSALKPAEMGEGLVVRVLNPTDTEQEAVLRLGFDVASAHAVRLDEEPIDLPVRVEGRTVGFPVPPRALRTLLVVPGLTSRRR